MAANEDIRIKLGVFTHPKFEELEERLGAEGQIRLFQLWGRVAMHQPQGVLDGWTVKTIGRQAGCAKSEAAVFVETLVDVGFLDFDGTTYSCHDWLDHQPWAATVKERGLWAKKMNEKKREKRRKRELARLLTATESGTESDTDTGTDTATDTATESAADTATAYHLTNSNPTTLPTPTPTPRPAPIHVVSSETPIDDVLALWEKICVPAGFSRCRPVLNSDRNAISAILDEYACGEVSMSVAQIEQYFWVLADLGRTEPFLKNKPIRSMLKPEAIRDVPQGAWNSAKRKRDSRQSEQIAELARQAEEAERCVN